MSLTHHGFAWLESGACHLLMFDPEDWRCSHVQKMDYAFVVAVHQAFGYWGKHVSDLRSFVSQRGVF